MDLSAKYRIARREDKNGFKVTSAKMRNLNQKEKKREQQAQHFTIETKGS